MTTTKAQTQVKPQTAQAQIHIQARGKTKLSLGELSLCAYGLRDVEEMHRHAPDTFWISPAEQRANLQPGQTVRLVFHQGWICPVDERMWVRIVRRDAEGYVGRLANEPHFITALKLGDVVRFTMNNVVKIYSAEDIAIAVREGALTRFVRAEAHGQCT
ncbi:DUF2314 domain-containing protein [Ramlibacter sp. MMS24-I3-19]|uniref:DUF2314 domain-containing protein n=1 Tax=Ramlibacter sp. MMS24-I3-19 TaxID=3416606 RepID=UPI003D00A76E